MKIILHGTHIELTPAIRAHVEEKLAMVAHHLDQKHATLAEARVEVGKPSEHHHKGKIFYAEVNLKLDGKLLRANCQHEDMRNAIVDAKNELQRQITKLKDKKKSTLRKLKG